MSLKTTQQPLTELSESWFIENEDINHTGNLFASELGRKRNGNKVCLLKSDDVRSAVEGLKDSIQDLPLVELKRRHLLMLIDKWFPVFQGDKNGK